MRKKRKEKGTMPNVQNISIKQSNNNGKNSITIQQSVITIETLFNPLRNLLTDLSKRYTDSAKNTLEVIKEFGNLDGDANELVSIVEKTMSDVGFKDIESTYATMVSFMDNARSDDAKQICLSLLLKIEFNLPEKKKRNFGRKYYNKTEEPFPLLQESYYEILASKEELEEVFLDVSKNGILDIEKLTGIVRGGLRIEEYELAKQAADLLKARALSEKDCSHAQILWLVTQFSFLLNKELLRKRYQYISFSYKKLLDSLIQELIKSIEIKRGEDKRIVELARAVNIFTLGEAKELREVCLKYQENIAKIYPEFVTQLLGPKEEEIAEDLSEETLHLTYFKMANNASLKDEKIHTLLSKNEITSEEGFLLQAFCSEDEITAWLQKGGKIIDELEFVAQFGMLEIFIKAYREEIPGARVEISQKIDTFLDTYKDKIPQINTTRLFPFIISMSDKSLDTQVCQFIEEEISKEDLWVSFMAEIYLNSLHKRGKSQTLNTIFDSMDTTQKNFIFLQIIVQLYLEQGEKQKAIEKAEVLVEAFPEEMHSWLFLLQTYEHCMKPKHKIEELLHTFPINLFIDDFEKREFNLILSKMVEFQLFDKVVRHLVTIYLKHRDKSVRFVSQFLFNALTDIKAKVLLDNKIMSLEDMEVYGAVHFKRGHTTTIAFLVSDKYSSDENVIDVKTLIGEKLLNAQINEPIYLGFSDFVILNRFSLVQALFSLLPSKRERLNDGSDSFRQIILPDNPTTEDIKKIENQIATMTSSANYIQPLSKKNIDAYFLDGSEQYHGNPFQVPIELFYFCDSNFMYSFVNTTNSIKETPFPKDIILDKFGIFYLAFSGLIDFINKEEFQFFVCDETKVQLNYLLKNENWFYEFCQRQLPLNNPIKMKVFSYFQEKNFIKTVFKRLENIHENWITVLKNEPLDFPENFDSIKKFLASSEASTIKLSLQTKLPILSFSHALNAILKDDNIQTINPIFFTTHITENVSFRDKESMLKMAISGVISYPIQDKDVAKILTCNDENLVFLLLQIFENDYSLLVNNRRENMPLLLGLLLVKAILNRYEFKSQMCLLADKELQKLFNLCFAQLLKNKTLEQFQKDASRFLNIIAARINLSKDVKRHVVDILLAFMKGHFIK